MMRLKQRVSVRIESGENSREFCEFVHIHMHGICALQILYLVL